MEFIWLLRIVGFLVWGFLLFCFIRPARHINNSSSSSREKAVLLVNQYGNTSIDYFKTYKDKTFFISGELDAFVSFRASNGFAIVLGEPVCDEEDKVATIKEFESFCRRQGLKPVFYRVDEDSIPTFNRLNKSKMMIGQEAIVDVAAFTLEGKDKKSLRNGINSLHKKGFSLTIHKAPQEEAFLKRLKVVSDDWLNSFDVDETVFSQGMFDEHELQQQDIIAVTDEAGNIKSFLNIIPDYAEDDCTYDLIRKTADAPGASMDALIIKLIEYAKENKKRYINLGLAPMTGITKPENPAEQFLKLVSRTKWFRHYESLREFKEKYATIWENKYLVFDNDFDLLQLPAALNNVMKP
jgi:phosphatidylglycerol lysyltransferase